MEFECWREWTGLEVAFFVSTFCDLPQYQAAIAQNLTGAKLQGLFQADMLAKGLSRAGVSDRAHQKRIAAAVGRLHTDSPVELNRQFQSHITDLSLKQRIMEVERREIEAPAEPKPKQKNPRRHIAYRYAAGTALTLAFAPEKIAHMQHRSPENAYDSRTRQTPRIRDGGNEPPPPDPVRGENVLEVVKSMRRRLASSLGRYEDMSQATPPLYSTMTRVHRLEPLQSPPHLALVSDASRTKAATTIQARFRRSRSLKQEKALPMPSKERIASRGAAEERRRQIEAEEEQRQWSKKKKVEVAALKIQASFRGQQDRQRKKRSNPAPFAGNDVLRGVKQAQYDRRCKKAGEARRTGEAERLPWAHANVLDNVHEALQAEERRKQAEAATKLQAARRGLTARRKTRELRRDSLEAASRIASAAQGTSRKSTEESKAIANVHVPSGEASVKQHTAATKLQANIRRRKAQQKLAQHKATQRRQGTLRAEEEAAATKIQAMRRGQKVRMHARLKT
mmetsp:Transcript_65790/g.183262  ORF Transcript_65790/g.183262 Transcript_65790/m.183262 type:complete len:509 (-) Transcript_65790:154-1680(-)